VNCEIKEPNMDILYYCTSRRSVRKVNLMHKVKTQKFGELLVKNMLISYFILL